MWIQGDLQKVQIQIVRVKSINKTFTKYDITISVEMRVGNHEINHTYFIVLTSL